MDLCKVKGKDLEKANEAVEKFAAEGYKTLGVARKDSGGSWQFLGILTLFDPPREDSAATIAHAKENGITVKMVTGDNVAIARQISGQLGLGQNIHRVNDIFKDDSDIQHPNHKIEQQIEAADGFVALPSAELRMLPGLLLISFLPCRGYLSLLMPFRKPERFLKG